MSAGQRRSAAREEIEALAHELVRDHGLSLDAARELARRGIHEVQAYAADWDRRAERSRPRQPPAA